MTRMEEAIEQALKDYLRPERIPPTEETWRVVQHALRTEPQRRRNRTLVRMVLAVAALFLIAVIGVGGAMAASPDLRDYLTRWVTMVGGQIKEGRLASLYPAPSFTVLQPTQLPNELRLVAFAYRPSPIEIGPVALPRPDQVTALSRIDGHDVPPEVVKAARVRAELYLRESREPVLILVYAAALDYTLELIERPHNGKSLPSGEAIWLRGLPAVFVDRDGRDVITWVERGTLVELHTRLGRAETMRIAEAVEATMLAPFETTEAGQHLPHPQFTPTGITLAQRVDTVEAPKASREVIRDRCGVWDGDPGSLAEISEQARCVARVAMGVDEIKGSSGTSRRNWREEAERLGLDPALGPSGNPMIWSVQFEFSEGRSLVVVLDAATGEPYLIVRLRPVP